MNRESYQHYMAIEADKLQQKALATGTQSARDLGRVRLALAPAIRERR